MHTVHAKVEKKTTHTRMKTGIWQLTSSGGLLPLTCIECLGAYNYWYLQWIWVHPSAYQIGFFALIFILIHFFNHSTIIDDIWKNHGCQAIRLRLSLCANEESYQQNQMVNSTVGNHMGLVQRPGQDAISLQEDTKIPSLRMKWVANALLLL